MLYQKYRKIVQHNVNINQSLAIKDCVRCICGSLFFSREPNFIILVIQISWRYQMPEHETGNIFYWITWEVNKVC